MTHTADKRTYSAVSMQGYTFSSIKFIFTEFYYNFFRYIITIPTIIITVIHHHHQQENK